jgi:hypothetical protein
MKYLYSRWWRSIDMIDKWSKTHILSEFKDKPLDLPIDFLWNICTREDEEMIDKWSKTHTLSEFKDKLFDLPINFLWNIRIREDEEMIDEWSKTHILSEFKEKLLDLPINFFVKYLYLRRWRNDRWMI